MAQLTFLDSLNAPGGGPVGLTWNGRFLWNTDFTTGRIYRIDPTTGEHDIELACPGNLSGLTWNGRDLWQSLHDGGTLRRINPETNDFDQTIMVHDHGWLSGVTWDGEKLWAVSQQHGKLFAIDPESGDVLRTLPAPVAAGDLAYKDDTLWLGYAHTMRFDPVYEQFEWESDEQHFFLAQIDPADGAILEKYPLDFVPMGLTWANDDLWLAHVASRTLHRAQLTP